MGTALLNIEGGVENPYLKKARLMIREEGEKLKAKLDRIRGFKAGEVNVNFIFGTAEWLDNNKAKIEKPVEIIEVNE